MVRDSVEWLVGQGKRVFLDAEHFFDGYKRNPEFALQVLHAAEGAGAEVLVLCDTNGGTLPHEVDRIVREVRAQTDVQIGVHFHDDGGTAVANTLAGVLAGATQVQGCVNGYGERTGNANLCSIVPDLTFKMGVETIPRDKFELLTPVAHHISELVNIAPDPQSPYVGVSAFAHKSGIHTSAIARARDAYEHLDPDLVGNGTRFVLSEQAGRSTVELKAREVGLELDGPAMSRLLDDLKTLEHRGYHFEAADGSLELLMRTATGWAQDFFDVESFRVITDQRENGAVVTEATIKVHVGEQRIVATAEGNGPVNALDGALRSAIGQAYPSLRSLHLTDYKVRVLDTNKGTGAVTRVLIDSTNGEESWSTIGVSENIIEASWQALSDSIVYGLLRSVSKDPNGTA
jgi:2-isopropylmalate synthase